MKKDSIINYIIGAVVIVVGIFIMANKETFLTIVMIVSGVLAILSGINDIRVFNCIKSNNYGVFISKSAVVKMVGNIIVGTLCIVMPLIFAQAVITALIYIIASYLLLSGVLALIQQRYFKSEDEKMKKLRSNLIAQGVIFILISILFFVAPMEITYAVINIIGIVLILIGAGIIAFTISNNKKAKAIETTYTEPPENK